MITKIRSVLAWPFGVVGFTFLLLALTFLTFGSVIKRGWEVTALKLNILADKFEND